MSSSTSSTSSRKIKPLTTLAAENLIKQLPKLREREKTGIQVVKEKIPDDLMEVITGKMALEKYNDFKSLKEEILHIFLPADNIFLFYRYLKDSINSLFHERRDEEGIVIPDHDIIKEKIKLLIFNFRRELIDLLYRFNYGIVAPKLKIDEMRNKLYEKYKIHDDNKLYSDILLFLDMYFEEEDKYDTIKKSLLKYVPVDYNDDDYNEYADITNKFIIDNLNKKLLKIIYNYYYHIEQEPIRHITGGYKHTVSTRKKKNKRKKTKKRRVYC